MLIVPLQPAPSQTTAVSLNGQNCQINVYTLTTGLYVDLYVDNDLIIGGVVALDRNVIVRSLYLGFVGDLAFLDTQGVSDPVYTDLGSRYVLAYFLPSELPANLV